MHCINVQSPDTQQRLWRFQTPSHPLDSSAKNVLPKNQITAFVLVLHRKVVSETFQGPWGEPLGPTLMRTLRSVGYLRSFHKCGPLTVSRTKSRHICLAVANFNVAFLMMTDYSNIAWKWKNYLHIAVWLVTVYQPHVTQSVTVVVNLQC